MPVSITYVRTIHTQVKHDSNERQQFKKIHFLSRSRQALRHTKEELV